MKSVLMFASSVLLMSSIGVQVRADVVAKAAPEPPPESFTGYGERVFRLQNALMDELMDAEYADPPPTATESRLLAKAEASIVRNCRALNEVASLTAGGERPSFALRMEAAASLRRCSASAREVRKFLNERAASAPP